MPKKNKKKQPPVSTFRLSFPLVKKNGRFQAYPTAGKTSAANLS